MIGRVGTYQTFCISFRIRGELVLHWRSLNWLHQQTNTIGLTALHSTTRMVSVIHHISRSQEIILNSHLALLGACGELFELSFDLPFHEFFPESILFKFWIQVECGDLNFYIPEDSTAHIPLQSIIRSCKIRNRDGSIRPNLLPLDQPTKGSKVKKWRHICQFRWAFIFLLTLVGHVMPSTLFYDFFQSELDRVLVRANLCCERCLHLSPDATNWAAASGWCNDSRKRRNTFVADQNSRREGNPQAGNSCVTE